MPFFSLSIETIYLSLLRAAGTISSFCMMVLMYRTFGDDRTAAFFLSITMIYGIAILARQGISEVLLLMIRQLETPFRRRLIAPLLVYFLYKCLCKAVVYILLLISILLLNNVGLKSSQQYPILHTLIFIGSPLIVSQQILAAAMKGLGNQKAAVLWEFVASPLITTIVAWGALTFGYSISTDEVSWVYLGALSISVCFFALKLKVFHYILRPVSNKVVRSYNIRTKHFFQIEIGLYLIAWSSLLILPFFLSTAEVGRYNLALRIATLISLVTSSVTSLLMQKIPNAVREKRWGDAHSIISTMQWAMIVFAAIYFLAILVLGRYSLSYFGTNVEETYKYLLILSSGYAIALLFGPTAGILSALKREAHVRNIILISASAGVLGSVIAGYFFGGNGVAIVTAMTFIVQKLGLRKVSKIEIEKLRSQSFLE